MEIYLSGVDKGWFRSGTIDRGRENTRYEILQYAEGARGGCQDYRPRHTPHRPDTTVLKE